MKFAEFINYINLSEAPKLTTGAVGSTHPQIEPQTGKPYRKTNKFEEFKRIVENAQSKGIELENIWASFSTVPRLGIYYKAEDGGTPLGLYAYPAKYLLERKLQVPYAGERPYLLVFEIINENMITIKHSDQEEIKDFSKVKHVFDQDAEKVRRYLRNVSMKINSMMARKAESISPELVTTLNKTLRDLYYNSSTKEEVLSRLDVDNINYKLRELLKHILFRVRFYDSPTPEKYQSYINYGDDEVILSFFDWSKFNQTYAVNDKVLELLRLLQEEFNFEKDIIKSEYAVEDLNEVIKPQIFRIFKSDQVSIFITPPEEDRFFSLLELYKSLNSDKRTQVIDFINKLKRILTKVFDKQEQIRERVINQTKFPLQVQLKKYCEQNSLDWTRILSKTLESLASLRSQSTSRPENIQGAFVYNFINHIKNELMYRSGRTSKSYILWTKIFRDLGIPGVTDEGHGVIYRGEPAQGAFFNPKQFRSIAMITMRQERPGKRGRSPGRTVDWKPEDSPQIRFMKGASISLGYANSSLRMVKTHSGVYGDEVPSTIDLDLRAISSISIAVKSYSKLLKKYPDVEKEAHVNNSYVISVILKSMHDRLLSLEQITDKNDKINFAINNYAALIKFILDNKLIQDKYLDAEYAKVSQRLPHARMSKPSKVRTIMKQ